MQTMIPTLLAQIGLPLIARLAGAGLKALDNPAADAAAEALREVDGVLRSGGVAPDALDAANRRIETEARSREAQTAWREVNATLRAETRAEDAYVRRWRPTFGYAVTAAWGLQMAAIAWTVVAHPGGRAGDPGRRGLAQRHVGRGARRAGRRGA